MVVRYLHCERKKFVFAIRNVLINLFCSTWVMTMELGENKVD